MKIILKIILWFLALVGALTLILAAYLYWVDPWNLWHQPATQSASPTTSDNKNESGNQFKLSPAQEIFLKKVGLDPAKLPTSISPKLENCLINAVGEDRANEIKSGAAPTAIDLLKAKNCF